MTKELTKLIKQACKESGINTRIRTERSITTVTFLSPPSDELLDRIKAMETVEAHGDIIDDTRWYSGQSISFRYDFELPDGAEDSAREIMSQWLIQWSRDKSHHDRMSTVYHIENSLRERLGRAVAQAYLDLISVYQVMDYLSDKSARLISAAPSMLNALESCLELLRDPDAEPQDADRVETLVRETLAMAKGDK